MLLKSSNTIHHTSNILLVDYIAYTTLPPQRQLHYPIIFEILSGNHSQLNHYELYKRIACNVISPEHK